MSQSKRTRQYAVALTLAFFAAPGSLLGCWCDTQFFPCGREASVIFQGKVIIGSGSEMGDRNAVLQVDKTYWGSVKNGETVELVQMLGWNCHYRLRTGRTYVVFGCAQEDGRVSTSKCTYTFGFKEVRNELSRGWIDFITELRNELSEAWTDLVPWGLAKPRGTVNAPT